MEAYQQGRYTEAEGQWKAALKEAEKFGEQDPRLATSLNNLGELYVAQFKFDEAEPLYKRSLAIREKALGLEHPDMAASLNNLALLYHAQGKYAEVEPLFKRSLAIREKALGPENSDVAISLNNLAEIYYTQSKYADAAPLFKRSLAIRVHMTSAGRRQGSSIRSQTLIERAERRSGRQCSLRNLLGAKSC